MPKKVKKTLVVLCLDSFKEEYLVHTPFLKKLIKKYSHGQLTTIYGYTGIGAAFVSGQYPQKTDVWTEFCFSGNKSTYFWLSYFESLAKLHPVIDKALRLFCTVIITLFKFATNQGYYFGLRQIPWKAFKYIEPTMNKAWCQKNCLPVPTFFDFLSEKKISWWYHDWPSIYHNQQPIFHFHKDNQDKVKLEQATQAALIHDVVWLRVWELDTISHHYGIDSDQVKQHLQKLDAYLLKLFADLQKTMKLDFLLWSDHGMVSVTKHVDLLGSLEKLHVEFFIDSTSIRFREISLNKEQQIRNLLKTVSGHFLSKKERDTFNLGSLDKFGSLIFVADPGICFTPNFYSAHQLKAMHGYNPNIPQQKGYYITNLNPKPNKKNQKNLHITDLFALLKSSFDTN